MPMEKMKLTFVNVGYGEAMLLECPDPSRPGGVFTALIDGGSAEASEFEDRASGRIPIQDYVSAHGPERIDLMVSTHTHEDHICGLLEAARLAPPAELWQTLPPAYYRGLRPLDVSVAQNPSQSKFLRALNDYITLCTLTEAHGGAIRALRAGDSIPLCPGLRAQVLAPSAAACAALEAQTDALYAETDPEAFLQKLSVLDARMNNYSLILRLDYGGTRILLPGDTNLAGYGGIPDEQLRADLFKVGHHGQIDGANQALADKVHPSAVVCCASSDRRYNSAHPDTLRLLKESGAALYFSDCPRLPELHTPPHEALVFEIGRDGVLDARYLPEA